ncbi:cell division protein SepF [Lacticaseibacillus baoqingensis]|uniref:Cell division protein SepF n=1 Tax=Lacticaseibacillus baoqingensis TaxID=2486013 RepID=A0ABW4E1F7_9LACO|nr:cell division protein SepF [Lacticaseibacillus baoqingensis]
MAFEKLGSKFNSFFAMDADEEPDAPVESTTAPQAPKPAAFRGNKVVAMSQPTEKTAKIVVYEPRIYSDAKEIGSHLLNNKAVVVNFDRIDGDAATRIVDFLTGLVFAIHGEIKRIGEQIFLVTPANFQIDGSLAQSLGVDADIQMTE